MNTRKSLEERNESSGGSEEEMMMGKGQMEKRNSEKMGGGLAFIEKG